MMNEITRIHLAKVPYDIEVTAKKQLEKYIKSLETYTQDADVLADIEIRMTELLSERGIAAGGVITSEDVASIRKQLGEPYEFATEGGDMALGPEPAKNGRRLYRSTDNAVLGGVLSGIAAYFGVNPLWTRLVFVLLLFISFGLASVAYVLFWILTPPARTATEKLQLAGKEVTLESIKALNADEETGRTNTVAPALQQVLSVGFGIVSLIAAVTIFAFTVWGIVLTVTHADVNVLSHGFYGMGNDYGWLAWIVFGIVVFGLLLLAALFGLIAYALLAKKLTKRLIISGIVIVVLGIASVATTIGIVTTQSWRVANEAQSLVRQTKANLPKEFSGVQSIVFEKVDGASNDILNSVDVRYVVDEGAPRYELSALPAAKPLIKMDGTTAHISLSIPNDYRNMFVRPSLTVYGPAVSTITVKGGVTNYAGLSQDSLAITTEEQANIGVSGTYTSIKSEGAGSVDLGAASVQNLTVIAKQNATVNAGTVKQLTVTQPDVCPSGSYSDATSVTVSGVTSGQIQYNGTTLPVGDHRTNCNSIIIDSNDHY